MSNMNCPHCGVHINPQDFSSYTWDNRFRTDVSICPSCNQNILVVAPIKNGSGNKISASPFVAYPAGRLITKAPQAVPKHIGQDYEEAQKVRPDSPKASAALARRALQTILREHGYTQYNLLDQIDAVLAESDPKKAIPSGLRATIDAVRNFGNFSSHPITDKTTLQVIDVEPDEAGWCIDIIEAMFDHYYVGPALAAEKKAKLDAKLKAAGKPPAR